MVKIKICDDFSDIPGGRYISEGEFSGELFRENILVQKYQEANEQNSKLEIDFDGCYGFGTSFLEEAFGGMVRVHHVHGMLKRLDLISTEDETIPENVIKYVKEAELKDR